MNIAIDIGSFKTTAAVFDEHNKIVDKIHFPTDKDFENFRISLEKHVVRFLTIYEIDRGIVSISGLLDLSNNYLIKSFGLSWRNIPILYELEKILKIPLSAENNTYLATIYESSVIPKNHNSLLYVSVSNDISYCFLGLKNELQKNVSSGDDIMVQKNSGLIKWSELVSGKSVIQNYGSPIKEIDDNEFWKKYSDNLAIGLWQLNVSYQPDMIIIGGIVGKYYHKYEKYLKHSLDNFSLPAIKFPELIKAYKPLTNTLYGSMIYLSSSGKINDK